MMLALTMIVDLEWRDARLKYKNLRESKIFYPVFYFLLHTITYCNYLYITF